MNIFSFSELRFDKILRRYLVPSLFIMLWLSNSAYAQIDYENLGSSGCPAAGQSAVDWDTFAECPSASGTWVRGPLFLGTSGSTCTGGSNKGSLQWSGTAFEYCTGAAWATVGGGGTEKISALTSAIGTSTIYAGNYLQAYTWNTLTTQNALTLSSTSETTGSLLVVSNTNTGTSTGTTFNITNTGIGTSTALQASITGASNTGYAAYFTNPSSTGYSLYSSGTSPNYFGGPVNIGSAYNYQINGNSVLGFSHSGGSGSASADATSLAAGETSQFNTSAGPTYNTAVGYGTLASTTTSAYNTAVGYKALNANGTVNGMTAVGYDALLKATSGPNDAFGNLAGGALITGQNNVALGYKALDGVVTGNNNIAVGRTALTKLTGASANVAVGQSAGSSATTAADNTMLGGEVMLNLTTGTDSDAFGYLSGYQLTTSGSSMGIGANTLGSTGSGNVVLGYYADYLVLNAAGAWNTLFGSYSGSYVGASSYNSVMGYNAYSGYNISSTGSDCTVFGSQAMGVGSAGPNDAFGYQAAYNLTAGTDNVYIGYQAAMGPSSSSFSGTDNTVAGYQALASLQYSVATTGTANTALGYQAGYAGTAITTGSYNTFVGYQAQSNSATYTNGTAIGNGAVLTASNSIVLGNTSISKIYAKVTSITAISDRRRKKDIVNLPSDLGLTFIEKLKPVSYRFNNGDETERYGFIAQDLETALPQPLQTTVETAKPEHGLALIERQNDKDRTYRVAYGELTASIVKAIQENYSSQQKDRAKIDQLKVSTHAELQNKIKQLHDRLLMQQIWVAVISLLAGVCGWIVGIRVGRTRTI